MTPAETVALLLDLVRLPPEQRLAALRGLPAPAARAIAQLWRWQAHGGQVEPPGDWRIWPIVAGRGFGKTRAGAEWVWAQARETADARIALVGPTLDEVVRVMVEGESGLIACARADDSIEERPIPSEVSSYVFELGTPFTFVVAAAGGGVKTAALIAGIPAGLFLFAMIDFALAGQRTRSGTRA